MLAVQGDLIVCRNGDASMANESEEGGRMVRPAAMSELPVQHVPPGSVLKRMIAGLCLTALAGAGQALSLPERLVDPGDGWLDLSSHLLDHSGILPVPIIITEPALGYGLGVTGVYFDESISALNARSHGAGDRLMPPNIKALGAFKTENDSWGAFAGYFHTFGGDRVRLLGGGGTVSLNLDYYGPLGRGIGYQLEGSGLMQQISVRLGESDWLLGARYAFLKTDASFGLQRPTDVASWEYETRIGRLGMLLGYDSRDNILTPGRGQMLEAEAAMARPWLGSDSSFEQYAARWFGYLPIGEDVVLGLRADAQYASDGTPFYARPYVSLRGVPALRYQDQKTLVGETELRWDFHPRWSAIGFTGVGKAFGKKRDWDEADRVVNKGVGFRYLIARRLGLYAGVDVAWGPEDSAFYIQVGSAWR